jgi:ABC-type transport system involved in multi-copper enzyme maturation permease subunit
MRSIIKYILLTAIRDRLFIGLYLTSLIAILTSSFLGNNSLSEQSQMQIAFISSSLRIIFVVGIILFICFHIKRSFDHREIEFLISRPVSRSKFLISYFISFHFIALLFVLPICALIIFIFKVNLLSGLIWSCSLFFELSIISSFAILASLMLQSAVASCLSSLAFYFISRIIGFAVSTIIIPAKISNISFSSSLEYLLKMISALLPRLDQFTQSKWLIYGYQSGNIFLIIVGQTIIYSSLILLMSIVDFNKKQF